MSGWQQELARGLLAEGVGAGAWVPDKRLAPIGAELVELGLPLRTLTREEECFGYAAGVRAAGGMPVVMLQCSGLGNSLNALGSLVVPYGLGFPLLISMRGTLGERNPAQMPLGRATVPLLDALGIQSFSLRDPGDAGALVRGVVAIAEGARQAAAIIIEPELEL